MVVASIVVITIIVFVVVDIVLRMVLERFREAQIRRERENALDIGLKLDVSAEARTLKRVELEDPKARILAVDDEKIILDSFRKTLVGAGYSIDTVEEGSEALGLIRKHDYDFVFTDLRMPGMDGVEVTKAVRHLRPDIDVIVITGYASIESAVETVRFGAMDYVQKPFTEDELLECVNTSLIKRQDRLEKQMRHTIRLIKPGTSESKSRFELNVPAGVFISPQHAWAKIELNGTVRVGLDDLIRKLFENIDQVELPVPGQKIGKGETLFSLKYGDYRLEIPSPLSGKITAVNSEHAEHPEWLAVKPFELSWMCGVEPSNLAAELPGLRIGTDSVDWYQKEIDRYRELANKFMKDASHNESKEKGESAQNKNADYLKLLAGFTKPFLGALLFLAFSPLCYPQDVQQAESVPAERQSESPAAVLDIPDEITIESSVGNVLFPHKAHVKFKCKRCHHQIHALELDTPHPDYLKSSWISCQDCHNTNSEDTNKYYKCSDCHHAEPENIADETLSSKVVVHKSCWKCHKTGTGAKASESCGDCHVKEIDSPMLQ